MQDKKYYWIKLKDAFMTSDTVDFLMGQPNGAEYVVLYQMICLKTTNTEGVLARQLGEILVPYDIEKIRRDTKYFKADTIRIALELYKRLGLVYEQENGILRIANFESLIGGETKWAEKKRIQRKDKDEDNVPALSYQMSAPMSDKRKSSDKEIDKDIKSTEIDKELEGGTGETEPRPTRFRKPTLEEIESFCRERNNGVDAVKFYNHYESVGWRVGKSPMKNWKACIITWERTDNRKPTPQKDTSMDALQEALNAIRGQ